VNDAVAEPSASRLAGVVTSLDRIFPLLWIGFYLLLPVSGWADEMFASWFDQQRDLEAVRSLVADGRADAIADSVIGPAYIGAAALVHDVFGLSPEDSLVALTRASYALSVAAGLVLVRVLVARWSPTPPIVSLASQLMLLALVFAAGTWYWSDVPWSHFFAAFLAVSIYAVRFAPSGPSLASAAAAGALLALLAATRSFELVAVVLAWGIAALGLRLLRFSSQGWSARRALAGVGAFVLTTAAVYALTGKRDLFFLYGNHLDRQSGSVLETEVAETPTFSLALVPVKLVQLFVDPCYLSLCQVSDYDVDGGQNVDLWSLPLAVQLPALLLLPLCVVGIGLVVVRAFRQRTRSSSAAAFRPLVEMTVAATGLVVGYAGSTLTGPSHLRYGFARDFVLPALLTAIVAVVLGSAASWHVLERRRREGRMSPEIRFVAASIVLIVAVVVVTTVARSNGLPRIEARHLGEIVYTARCVEQRCDVRLEAETPSGAGITIPDASTLTFGCGSARPRVTVYTAQLGDGVEVASSCRRPRLVAAWPTVMGLPPGSFELGFVDVRNV
jgi:hypothetical protein